MNLRKIAAISTVLLLSACVSSSNDDVLRSASQSNANTNVVAQTHNSTISRQLVGAVKQRKIVPAQTPNISFASEENNFTQIEPFEPAPAPAPPPPPRIKKTYLINGLASSVKSIGYGFTNLSQKIPSSKLHNYASFVESSTVIRSKVTREIVAAHKANPDIEINLIGISFGANIVTWIAQELNRKKIPVNYLATLEGPAMAPIYKNVRLADNFSCTDLTCFRTSSKLAWGNKKTDFSKFKYKSSHIALANHPQVHARVISQINKPLSPILSDQFVAQ